MKRGLGQMKTTFLEKMKNARERNGIPAGMDPSNFVGWIRMYCENPDCCAREVDIEVKEFDENVKKLPLCPLCRKGLNTHAVESSIGALAQTPSLAGLPIYRIIFEALAERGPMWDDLRSVYSRIGGGCPIGGKARFEHWKPILLDVLGSLVEMGLIEHRPPSYPGDIQFWRSVQKTGEK